MSWRGLLGVCLVLLFAKAGVATVEEGEDRSKEIEDDFDMFDRNKDKFIDAQEVMMGYRGDLAKQQVMEFFRDVDKNDDALVSFSEYLDFALAI